MASASHCLSRTRAWIRTDRNVVDRDARQAEALNGQAADFGRRLSVVHRQRLGKLSQVGPAGAAMGVWEFRGCEQRNRFGASANGFATHLRGISLAPADRTAGSGVTGDGSMEIEVRIESVALDALPELVETG